MELNNTWAWLSLNSRIPCLWGAFKLCIVNFSKSNYKLLHFLISTSILGKRLSCRCLVMLCIGQVYKYSLVLRYPPNINIGLYYNLHTHGPFDTMHSPIHQSNIEPNGNTPVSQNRQKHPWWLVQWLWMIKNRIRLQTPQRGYDVVTISTPLWSPSANHFWRRHELEDLTSVLWDISIPL